MQQEQCPYTLCKHICSDIGNFGWNDYRKDENESSFVPVLPKFLNILFNSVIQTKDKHTKKYQSWNQRHVSSVTKNNESARGSFYTGKTGQWHFVHIAQKTSQESYDCLTHFTKLLLKKYKQNKTNKNPKLEAEEWSG